MDDGLDERIEYGRQIAQEQIAYFNDQFGAVESSWKSDGSRVTEADLHLSYVFADALLERFPDDQFFSEELDHGETPIEVKRGYSWLLDPIDGTNNFARSIPTCSISLALMRDGVPIYGYIYDRASGHLLHGGPGKGLFSGEKQLEPEFNEITPQSLISQQCHGLDESIKDENALQRQFKMRAFGSSALHMAYAALGWTDGVIAHRVKSWDIAAGVAMMKAAGGCTRYFDTEVFPLKSFSSQAAGFGHIAGSKAMCDAMEKAMGRSCAFTDED